MFFQRDTVIYTSSLTSDIFNISNPNTSIVAIDSIDYGISSVSLHHYLNQSTGIFTMNVHNYAQDLRLSVRGFGARSAFGIRGIKILVDGIPSSTPDGQGQVDDLNLFLTKTIEINKGPASALFGNASGGVIQIFNKNNIEQNYFSIYNEVGSFNRQLFAIESGFKLKKWSTIFSGSLISIDGYREHSKLLTRNLDLKSIFSINKKSQLIAKFNFTGSPIALDPGSLKIEDVKTNTKQANQNNINYNAGEQISHLNTSLLLNQQLNDNVSHSAYLFYSKRNFHGRLPFKNSGQVKLNRNHYGAGTTFKFSLITKASVNNTIIKMDYARQGDLRKRFDNNFGAVDTLRLNQLESFQGIGTSLHNIYSIKSWSFQAGVRFDHVLIGLDDHFYTDGNDSGRLFYTNFNYHIGIQYNLKRLSKLFATIRTSFETPSLSELSANPENIGGFNINLAPMKSINYEVGLNTHIYPFLNISNSLFFIKTVDEIRPFEIADQPQRVFYRNIGQTERIGFENRIELRLLEWLKIKTNYDYSNFSITNKNSNKKKVLPGIPMHRFALIISSRIKNQLSTQLEWHRFSTIFANDENSISIPTYSLLNFTLKFDFKLLNHKNALSFGVQNILDEKYYDNIRINAFGGRYYEPAPNRNFYLAWKLTIS